MEIVFKQNSGTLAKIAQPDRTPNEVSTNLSTYKAA